MNLQDTGVELAFFEGKFEKALDAEVEKGPPVRIITVNDNGVMTN